MVLPKLGLRPESFYSDSDIKLNSSVTGVDAAEKTVRTADGASIKFDRLCIASGSKPGSQRSTSQHTRPSATYSALGLLLTRQELRATTQTLKM
jgi:NAD(P)H-nitrite reductase large subunit